MPNAKTHVQAGLFITGITSLGFGLRFRTFNPFKLVLSLGLSVVASRLPDILEPATSPNHRSFFHSFIFGLIVGGLSYYTWRRLQDELTRNEADKVTTFKALILEIVFIVLLCFSVHLVLDAFTKKSLPLI